MTELKEPKNWTPPEIPGLVRKKRNPKQVVTEVEPVKEEATVTKQEAPATQEVPTLPEDYGIEQLHTELMTCLLTAQNVTSNVATASEIYYVLCERVQDHYTVSPSVGVLDTIIAAINTKAPEILTDLIAEQADMVVLGWNELSHISAKIKLLSYVS